MSTSLTPKPRYRIEQESGCLRITLPLKRNWLALVFMASALLVMGYFIVAISTLGVWMIRMGLGTPLTPETPDPTTYPLMTFAGWVLLLFVILAAGLFSYGVFAWLWRVAGKEVYSLDNSHLTLEKHLLKRVFRRRRFARKDVRALRVQSLAPPGPFANSARNDWGYSGVIAFDAGAETHRFGQDVTDAEARQIIAAIVAFGQPT